MLPRFKSKLFTAPVVYDAEWLATVKDKPNVLAWNILTKHPDIKEAQTSNHTTMTYMVAQNKLKMVEALSDFKDDDHGDRLINQPGEDKRTPIEEALHRGNLPIFIYLLEHPDTDIKSIQDECPRIFKVALHEFKEKRLSYVDLLKLLESKKASFVLPELTIDEKLLIYNDAKLLKAALDRKPVPLDLLKNLSKEGPQEGLVPAILNGKPDIVKVILENPDCKEAFLNTTVKGLSLLECALGVEPSKKSLDIILELVKAGAPINQSVYEQLTDLSRGKINKFKKCFDIRNACLETKEGAALRKKLYIEGDEEQIRDIMNIFMTLFQAAWHQKDNLDDLGLNKTTLKKALEVYPKGIVKDLHTKRFEGNQTSRSFLGGFKIMGKEFLLLVDPTALAKLYYQQETVEGKPYTVLTGDRPGLKKAYINLMTPYVGFLLLKEHLQNKLEKRIFTESSQGKLQVFCKIIHFLIQPRIKSVIDKQNYNDFLATLGDPFSSQHDFPHMLRACNELSIDRLVESAKEIDEALRKERGPLHVKYLQIMDTFVAKVNLKLPSYDDKTLKPIFQKLCPDILNTLKNYGNSPHTWITYPILMDQLDHIKMIISKIRAKEDDVARAQLLTDILNHPCELKMEAKKTPVQLAFDRGNFPILTYLLSFKEVNLSEDIAKNLPDIFLELLHQFKAGSLDQADLIQFIQIPHAFKFPELTYSDKQLLIENTDILKAVLEKKPPEIEILKNVDSLGNNVLSRSIVSNRLDAVIAVLDSKIHRNTFLNEPVTGGMTPLEIALAEPKRNLQIIYRLLKKNPKISLETYNRLTDVFDFNQFSNNSTISIIDKCKETTDGKEYQKKDPKEQEKALFGKIFNALLSTQPLLQTTCFTEFKGKISDIHLIRFSHRDWGDKHTALYLFTHLSSEFWPLFMSIIEPHSLAKLYVQKAKCSDGEYFRELTDDQYKIDFITYATPHTGFFLIYEYLNGRLRDQNFTDGAQKKLDVLCEVIFYLMTHPAIKGEKQAAADYQAFFSKLTSFCFIGETQFPAMMNSINKISYDQLTTHALTLHNFILNPDQMGPLKVKYMETMDKIAKKYEASEKADYVLSKREAYDIPSPSRPPSP